MLGSYIINSSKSKSNSCPFFLIEQQAFPIDKSLDANEYYELN